jgi:hypothetical protein
MRYKTKSEEVLLRRQRGFKLNNLIKQLKETVREMLEEVELDIAGPSPDEAKDPGFWAELGDSASLVRILAKKAGKLASEIEDFSKFK